MVSMDKLGKIAFNGPCWLRRKLLLYMRNVIRVIRSVDKDCVCLFSLRKDFGITTNANNTEPAIESLPLNVSQSYLHVSLLPYFYALKFVQNRRVLEIGCNWGYGANILADSAADVTAFDISSESIQQAQKSFKKPNLVFFVHDANQPFPLNDDSYDFIFANEVIEHIRDQHNCIKEASRILKSDGMLVMKTPNVRYDRYGHRINKWHVKVLSPREYYSLLLTYFRDIQIYGYDEIISYSIEKEDVDVDISQYKFGDPITLSRDITIKGFVIPQLSDASKGCPEYLLAIAAKPKL